MKAGICVTLIALLFVDLSEAATKLSSTDSSIETISSLEQADALVRATQEQFWQLFPPSDDWLYVHSDKSVKPVIWSSGWPNALKKQMYAEMRAVNGNLYPVYTLWAEADRVTGDLTYFNMFGQSVWTSPAPVGCTPLSPVPDRYCVESAEEPSRSQQNFTTSAIGLEFQLIPVSFRESYEKDMVLEQQTATFFSDPMAMAPMSMTMSAVADLQMGINSLSNGTVEIEVAWPNGFSDTVEIYSSTDLVAGDWQFAFTNITTSGSTNHVWMDSDTNQTRRFYIAGNADVDEDSDGLASARERYLYKTRSDLFDTDGDGLGDGWEMGCGLLPLSSAGINGALGDTDSDGFSNLEEQLIDTDPNSFNSGGDTGAVATIRYYYDNDDRLTDFYCGSEVAQKTILTASHNVSEEVSAK